MKRIVEKMYKVQIERKAQKKLAKIPTPYFDNIKIAILGLGNNPRPLGCKKLRGREAYRIRVANYRVVYEIQDNVLLIQVLEIGHRKEIYER